MFIHCILYDINLFLISLCCDCFDILVTLCSEKNYVLYYGNISLVLSALYKINETFYDVLFSINRLPTFNVYKISPS